VVVKPVQHAEIVAAAVASQVQLEIRGDPGECGPNVRGERHSETYECANWDEEEHGGGCKVAGHRMEHVRLNTLAWTPTLLDHYWERGIDDAGMVFLKDGKFVRRYK
jgi:hypothetical protein